jgi:hypothetical protein
VEERKEHAMKPQATQGFWQFVWARNWLRLSVGSILAGALFFILFNSQEHWWNWAEPLVTFLILGVAAAVWYQQNREEWEEDHLPKRLTARFFYKGTEVMRCEKAHVASEGDIRALSQQTGAQMAKKNFLSFAIPDVQVSLPHINKSQKYVFYTATLDLTELPDTLATDKVRYWREPFLNSDGSPSWKDVPASELPAVEDESPGATWP